MLPNELLYRNVVFDGILNTQTKSWRVIIKLRAQQISTRIV